MDMHTFAMKCFFIEPAGVLLQRDGSTGVFLRLKWMCLHAFAMKWIGWRVSAIETDLLACFCD
jgi:hypothetical protein